jgi:RNase adapter protein RapZ
VNSGKTTEEKETARGRGKPSRVVIITGLSGSGKTVALRTMEDLHFFCIDNLPVSLIGALVSRTSDYGDGNIAIGIDIREKDFLSGIEKVLDSVRAKCRLEILFLEADTDVVVRRYKETRRPHPLGGDLEEAIQSERDSLSVLRQNADRVIDTSSFSPHQLRHFITSLYYLKDERKDLTVSLMSFGFKFGVPQNIDLLFDVRFLPNPNFVPSLKRLTGMDSRVSDYVFAHEETRIFMKKIEDLLHFLLPFYVKEGRSYLSIAIGCTGGNHRSPAIIEELAKQIRSDNIDMDVIHRELS